jgi:hypothetical protein
MAADVFKVLIIFAFITAIVLGSQYFQVRKRARIHETIELALRQGQPAPPELLALITRPDAPSQGPSDLKWGLVTLSAGIGLGIFGQVMGAIDLEARTAITGTAAIPTCIGLAGVLLHFLGRKSA